MRRWAFGEVVRSWRWWETPGCGLAPPIMRGYRGEGVTQIQKRAHQIPTLQYFGIGLPGKDSVVVVHQLPDSGYFARAARTE